jgi:hypothetical protein
MFNKVTFGLLSFLSLLASVLLILWQLPQTLAGLVLALFVHGDSSPNPYFGGRIVRHDKRFAVSLGYFIFVPKGSSSLTWRHEAGHSRQSVWLGPLYLLVVGLPSALHSLWFRKSGLPSWEYYSAFPIEKWADSIAGISIEDRKRDSK